MSRLLDALRGTERRKERGSLSRRVPEKLSPEFVSGPLHPDRLQVCRTQALNFPLPGPALSLDGVSRESEEYRLIRTRMLYSRENIRVLLIASPGPGDGKTVTSFNLAATLALRADQTVLLVEADLRRSSLSALLGIAKSPGLANVLSGACRLEDALVRIEQVPNLFILPAGDSLANPAELLDNQRWQQLASECRGAFGTTILDGPPVECVADYALLQDVADSVIVVVRQDHTNRIRFKKALSVIPKQKFLGVILNCVTEWFLWKQPNYSYYYSDSSSK